MTTHVLAGSQCCRRVVEAYRLERYDNFYHQFLEENNHLVVEAYRLERYDNKHGDDQAFCCRVVEAYRLDRYDNINSSGWMRSTQVVEAYRLERYDNNLTFG